MTRNNEITRAVRAALITGAVATAGVTCNPAFAQEQPEEAPAAAADEATTVTVTGSRIRRVDEETASPVFVLDQSAIQNSGVTTMGDLIQRVPAISGAATNPSVNNGGGSGESNVELRGLGAQRTLVLLNGRRIGLVSNVDPQVSAVDINMIPINMIERVEVLKEGAGAIYGSDAIAGVVNFITRESFDGAEANLQYGQTSEDDGENTLASLLIGSDGERLDIMVGGNYNRTKSVSAGDRDFARFALYLYGGVVSQGGSSRTPTGFIELPDPLAAQFGCSSVTHVPGTPSTDLASYRCFEATDAFNYQPFNLLMTPQERSNLFTFANYSINDYVETYAEVVYSHTSSNFLIAPLPFDATQDDVMISAQSVFNPFGVDLGGGSGLNNDMRSRLTALGNREGGFTTDNVIANVGFRGSVFETDWQWDLNAGIGRMDQDRNIAGYLFQPALRDALGPSFIDPTTGQATCGAPGDVVEDCTPIDIFNVTDPVQIAALQSIQSNYQLDYTYRSKQYALNLDGPVYELPAGEMMAAVGAEYRDLEGVFTSDVLTRAQPPLFLGCLLAQETCTGDSSAQYHVRELYGELFVPVLSDLPAIQSLNLSVGVRYSDYSLDSIGDSTNAQFKLEWRPIDDILLRASFAEVFRAPTINDLSLAPTQNAPTFNDPCIGLTDAAVATNPNLALACVNVPRDGSFSQDLSQITGLFLGSPDLEPETGDVTTFGVVYDSSQIRGLSLTLDFWQYEIDDIITGLDPNFAAGQCVATGAPQFCGLIFRLPPGGANPGQIQVVQQPVVNLGKLETDGVDFGVKYALSDTPLGSFQFSLDTTYINSYESTSAPGAPPEEIAGTFSRQFGNYAEWRGLLGVGWRYLGFDGLLTGRYIHGLDILDPDGAPGVQPPLEIGSVTYLDLTGGYMFPTDTKLQLGIRNLTDKQPPIFFQNNVLNANTDVSTYDLLGRQYFVSVTQTF